MTPPTSTGDIEIRFRLQDSFFPEMPVRTLKRSRGDPRVVSPFAASSNDSRPISARNARHARRDQTKKSAGVFPRNANARVAVVQAVKMLQSFCAMSIHFSETEIRRPRHRRVEQGPQRCAAGEHHKSQNVTRPRATAPPPSSACLRRNEAQPVHTPKGRSPQPARCHAQIECKAPRYTHRSGRIHPGAGRKRSTQSAGSEELRPQSGRGPTPPRTT